MLSVKNNNKIHTGRDDMGLKRGRDVSIICRNVHYTEMMHHIFQLKA